MAKLRFESLRAVVKLSFEGVPFEQAVFGYDSESLFHMNKFIDEHPELFKFGIPFPWEQPWGSFLERGERGALLLDDLSKRIEGDEPIKP